MRRLLAVGLVVVLLVGTVPVAPVLGLEHAHDATGPAQTPDAPLPPLDSTSSHALDSTSSHTLDHASQKTVYASQKSMDDAPQTLATTENFDNVEFHITVYENGTAEWTFTYQRTLNNESERQQFEQFADEFNNNSTGMWRDFQQQARKLTSAGQNTTGRTMKAQNFRKEAQVGGLVNNNRGIVKMSFQWTGFTYSNEETIIIGDVFEGGLYIGPNQSVVVHSGPGLTFKSADPMDPAQPSGETLAASESVTWQGEYDFIDQRPRVKFDPVPGTTTTTTTTNGSGDGDNATSTGTTQPGATGPSGDGWSLLMMFIGAVVVLLGLAAAFAWRQGDFGSFTGSTDNPGGGESGGGGTAAAGNGSTTPTEPSVSDEELLTDEARVKKLLDENGGRMKQVNIVEETGWSKSKVSMLLSEMEEDGEISKLRVGRENIISLEGHEPDAAGSPLEE